MPQHKDRVVIPADFRSRTWQPAAFNSDSTAPVLLPATEEVQRVDVLKKPSVVQSNPNSLRPKTSASRYRRQAGALAIGLGLSYGALDAGSRIGGDSQPATGVAGSGDQADTAPSSTLLVDVDHGDSTWTLAQDEIRNSGQVNADGSLRVDTGRISDEIIALNGLNERNPVIHPGTQIEVPDVPDVPEPAVVHIPDSAVVQIPGPSAP